MKILTNLEAAQADYDARKLKEDKENAESKRFVSPLAYNLMLEKHDWYYEYSDDHRVYSAGRRYRDMLLCHTRACPTLKEMYYEYKKKMMG